MIKSFSKLKAVTKNSLFYSAASHAKIENTEKAQQILEQAKSLSGETIVQFLNGQNYEKLGPLNQLTDALNRI